MDTSPRIRAEAEIAAEEARVKEQARAEAASRAERMAQLEAVGRIDAATRALPDELFAADPEIQTLHAERDAKVRRLQVNPSLIAEIVFKRLNQVRAAIKAGRKEIRDAALDDALAGDFEFPRVATAQLEVEANHQREQSLQAALDILNSESIRHQLRQDAQEATLALNGALLDRKRQYVREHPELLEAPAADATPAERRTRIEAPPSRAQFSPEENDDELDHPNYAMPVTLPKAAEVQAVPITEVAPAANDVVEL